MHENEDCGIYVQRLRDLYGFQIKEDEKVVWDDCAVIKAFDRAMNIDDLTVAHRLAMATNSAIGKKAKAEPQADETESVESDTPTEWKEGMPCRTIFEDDGLEYEAFIISIGEGDECIIQFLGYDGRETVQLSSLKRSLGNEARLEQLNRIEEALRQSIDDDGFESQFGESLLTSESTDICSDSSMQRARATPFAGTSVTEMSGDDKKKYNKKRSRDSPRSNYNDSAHPPMPNMAMSKNGLPHLPMPDMNMFRDKRESDMEIPPPPLPWMLAPLHASRGRADEGQAISDMLLAWYMTGYYTGLYQAQKKTKHSRRH